VTTTGHNLFIGENAGNFTMGADAILPEDASYDIGIGDSVLGANTTGGYNVALGNFALGDNTTGGYNVALGNFALGNNTTGGYNVALGNSALRDNTTGGYNVALGNFALGANTTGFHNVALGNSVLGANTTGYDNVALGNSALGANTTGGYNVALGNFALGANTTGIHNVALGNFALGANTTGDYNVAIGRHAGSSLTTGTKNVFIGYHAQPHAVTDYNEIVIGANTEGNGSNTIQIGPKNVGMTMTIGNYTNSTLNVHKISTDDIDPIFTIGGKHYATHGLSMTGIKEETSGVLTLDKNSAGLFMARLDFLQSPEGSDLWLFGRVTNIINNQQHFNETSCLLTPNFSGEVWYEKEWDTKSITIFARPNNSKKNNVEVSYRLTAPRFDSSDLTNYSHDGIDGLNIDKFLLQDKQ